MTTVPQEIIDMIIQFLAQDRSSLLACSLAGSSFYSPSRAHLFAGIEVNSLQRFQGLLELSYASLTTFDHESFKSFSSVRTISVWDVEGWVTPETLPSLLFLPSLAPFPNVKNFRIDNLVLPSYVGAEASSMVSVVPHTGPCIGIEDRLRFGTSRGIATNELFADPRDFLSPNQRPTASLEALSLGNCRVSSLGWFLRYTSCFPDLKSLSLINFTWGSAGGADVDRGPSFQCPQPILQPPRGLSELTLEIEYTPVVACAPSLLFKSLSESLRVLRLGYIDMFISVHIDEGSIQLDPTYITLSPLNFLTHLTLPPVAVWLQAKQLWLLDLLSTITSTSNLEELNIHLHFSSVAIKAQLDTVMWSSVDLVLGRKWGEELECGIRKEVRAGRCGDEKGYVFTNLAVVQITSEDFNPERPSLDGDAKSRIKDWLIGYMPRIYGRGVLQVPSDN